MRGRWSHLVFLLAVILILLSACKPSVPSKYLQPDEMEDLMYDYYVSQGMSNSRVGTTEYQNRYNMESVLRKYNLTSAEFDSSLVYYYNHMERMNEIYSNIQKRLSEEALQLGTSAGEVERYTIQSTSGDTTDVWEGRRQLMLLPIPPYHITQFTQQADTSFHKGDSFLLTFGSTFMVQSGARSATAYLAVTYENDSVVTTTANINGSGGTTLWVSPCELKAKRLDGYVYMLRRDVSDNTSEMCFLMLDHIQLMRFHHHENQEKTDKEQKPAPAAVPVNADTIDSVRPPVRRFGQMNQQTKPTITRQ